jgi:hypothetical protein
MLDMYCRIGIKTIEEERLKNVKEEDLLKMSGKRLKLRHGQARGKKGGKEED